MSKPLRIVISGGGTGGHINPALAIAGIIKSNVPDAEFLFAGTPNHMEATLVPQAGYKLAEIVYSDQEDQTAQGGQGGDDVVDADYEVVDE